MSITLPVTGSTNWDVSLDAALTQLDTEATNAQNTANSALTVATAAVPKDTQVYNVLDHGAVGNGVTDDSGAINTLIASLTAGVVYFPPKNYAINAPIVLGSNITLAGTQGLRVQGATDIAPLARVSLLATFSGVAAVSMVNGTTGQRIRDMNFDCSLATGTVDGINATGFVHDVVIDRVNLYKPPHNGVTTTTGSGSMAYSWTMTSVTVNNCGNIGFSMNSTTDTTLYSCEAIGCGSSGFSLNNLANSHLTDCRAEFSGASGFNLNGAWSNGNGSGGCIMTGCSSDRNVNHGLSINCTGNAPIFVNGFMARRDGSNGTGFGVNVSAATNPVFISGLTVYPGTNDDGSGTLSPITGFEAVSSTYVSLASGWIHGATNSIVNGGSNTVFRLGPNIGQATGAQGSPTFNYNNPWGTDNGSTFTANLVANDQTAIKAVQAATFTNLNNAMIDLTSGTAGTDYVFKSKVQADTNSRFGLNSSGQMNWGPGNAVFDTDLYRSSAAVVKTDGALSAVQSIRINTTSLGGGVGVLAIANATTNPSSNPTTGGVLYVNAGALTYRGSSGTVTVIANA
jgi:hypothetical protein